jgi:carbon monoxide dehydrogenase subunit G
MKIAPQPEIINTNSTELFDLLSDLTNYINLFPKDKIDNWSATKESCTFKIKGLAEVGLKIVASTPNTIICIDSHGKAPFKFTLNFYLEKITDNETSVSYVFEANINPFMKMMAEKPLTQFFNEIIVNLKSNY